MSICKLRLITFDLTNTLLKLRCTPGKQYGDVGVLHGIYCDNKTLTANFKPQWMKMDSEFPNFGYNSQINWKIWWYQLVLGTFKDSNVQLDHRMSSLISNYLIDLYETSTCWRHSKGACSLLSFLKNQDISLGIISNFDPRLEIILKNMNLGHYFNFVIGSYKAGMTKPNSEIFHMAMSISKLKDLKPEQCLHIGDNVSLDYYGAKKSGWKSILICSKHQEMTFNHYHTDVNKTDVYWTLYDLHRSFALDIYNTRSLNAYDYL